MYPAFGDALTAITGLPVGVSPTGHTGTGVGAWRPEGDLYPRLLARIRALGPGGLCAVLWHQGETDIDLQTSEEAYRQRLKRLVNQIRADAGWEVPWVVARASFPELPRENPVRLAQAALCQEGVVLPGPDSDPLNGAARDTTGVHFSAEGLRSLGGLWCEAVQSLLPR